MRFPWDNHVRPLSELPEEAQREAIAFDRFLYQEAERHAPSAAARCIENKIHYRTGKPRLGEPLYRTPEDAENNWGSMHCGRGTGHLGTGLYFFGTLSAAVAAPRWTKYALDEDKLREGFSRVWVVDVSSVPEDEIFYTGRPEQLHGLHGFAEALICYPDYAHDYREAEEQLALVDTRVDELSTQIEALLEGEGRTPDLYYDLRDERDELWEQRRALADKKHRAMMSLHRYTKRIELDAPRFEIPKRDVEDRLTIPPRARAAIEAYERDERERRFPGYHPMTYYMRSLGFSLVIHRSWDQINNGDVGNLWYPDVSP